MRLGKTACFLALLLAPVLATRALASPYDHFGLSSRASAMGNAYTALATNYTGVFYNPGALVFSQGASVGLGAMLSNYNLKINSQKKSIDSLLGINIGAVLPFSGMFEGRTAFGMALFLANTSLLYDVTSHPQDDPFFVIEENRPAHMQILFDLAVRLTEGLSIGGGLQVNQYLYTTVDVAVNTKTILGDTQSPIPMGNMNILNLYKGTPTAGIYYRPLPNLRFGLSYREHINFRLKLVSTINITGAKDLLNTVSDSVPVQLTVDCLVHYTPRKAVLGVAYDPISQLTASFDLAWMDWSAFPSPAPRIEAYSPVPEINAALQSTYPPMEQPKSPGFHDTLVPKLGVEYRLYKWLALRAGYEFTPSPVPSQPDGKTNYLDSSRNTFTIGTGFRFLDPIGISVSPMEVSLHFQYHQFNQRKVTRDYTASGAMFNSGLDLEFNF